MECYRYFTLQSRCLVMIFPSGRNTRVRNHRGSRGHPVPEPPELTTPQGPSSNTTMGTVSRALSGVCLMTREKTSDH